MSKKRHPFGSWLFGAELSSEVWVKDMDVWVTGIWVAVETTTTVKFPVGKVDYEEKTGGILERWRRETLKRYNKRDKK